MESLEVLNKSEVKQKPKPKPEPKPEPEPKSVEENESEKEFEDENINENEKEEEEKEKELSHEEMIEICNKIEPKLGFDQTQYGVLVLIIKAKNKKINNKVSLYKTGVAQSMRIEESFDSNKSNRKYENLINIQPSVPKPLDFRISPRKKELDFLKKKCEKQKKLLSPRGRNNESPYFRKKKV